jgi:DNA polymerase III psi subunit
MNKNQILDLIGIPRWELRDKDTTENTYNIKVIKPATNPQFISIIENEALSAEDLNLANAIAKACKVEPENHLIFCFTPTQEENLATFAAQITNPGLIVIFGEKLAENIPLTLFFKNWTIIQSSKLNNLQSNPQLKKQLWHNLQQRINK